MKTCLRTLLATALPLGVAAYLAASPTLRAAERQQHSDEISSLLYRPSQRPTSSGSMWN